MRDNEHATKDIIDHIFIVIMLSTAQRMEKNLMNMRTFNAKGEKQISLEARWIKDRATSDITIIGCRRGIGVGISFIAIGLTCTYRRRATQLRRNARWPFADAMRRPQGRDPSRRRHA